MTTYAPTGAGALKSTFGYDGMGRQVRQQDWTGDGSGVAYDRQVTYDAKGRVSYETDVQKQGNDTYTSYVSNAFADGGGTAYALGAVTSSTNASYKNGAYQSTASTATSYAWYDAAVQSQVDYSPGTGGTYHTWYTNSATGVLQSASVQDGRPRSISLTNDALGQALRRDEADGNGATGDPHEVWYRFNGKQIGYIGNNDTDNIGYAASLQRRVTASVAGPFKNGQTYGAGIVEFDQAYDAINSYQQGAGGGSYTVRDGDSLSGIAAQLWGDAGLWYKLAQANGLSGDGGLAAGQTLSVPAGVVRSSNTAATFRPYDVSQAYGDSSPTTPSPTAARKNKCGAFGAILLVAIAVAVTLVLKVPVTNLLAFGTTAAPAGAVAGTAAAIGGAAIAGAAASVASQGFGVATGIQDKFSWSGVALAGISAGLTQGIGIDKIAGSATLGRAASGAIASALTQGIGVATGLQSKFDWAGVAAAGIGAGAGQALGGSFAKLGKVGGALAANTVGGLANAATRSLVNGTDFGDNLIAALPDIIGQTVGSWAAGAIGGSTSPHWHPEGDDQPVTVGAVRTGSSMINSSHLAAVCQQTPDGWRSVPNVSTGEMQDIPPGIGGPSSPTIFVDASLGTIRNVRPTETETRNANMAELANGSAGAASSITPGTGQAVLALEAIQWLGDGISSVLNGVADWTYQTTQGALNSLEERGVFNVPLVGGALSGIDIGVTGIHTVANTVFSLPSAAVHPVRTFMGIAATGARFIDGMTAIDSKPAGQFISDTVATAGSLTPRQWRNGIGVTGGVAASFFLLGPREAKFFGGEGNLGVDLAFRELRAAEDATVIKPKPYSNPTNRPRYGSGQVDEVWANALRNGQAFDPNTGDLLTWDRTVSRTGQWDMGHLPGQEYRVLHGRYMSGEIDLGEFLREYRNPLTYRPELPSANRSRRYDGR